MKTLWRDLFRLFGGGRSKQRAALVVVVGLWLFFLLFFGVARAAPTPPPVIPFEIPTYSGAARDFRDPLPPIAPAPVIDPDRLWRLIVNCFPERVRWGLDVSLVAGSQMMDSGSVSAFESQALARHYIGIVARMPLYSATELNRERQQEQQRREQVAGNVKTLLVAVADRRRAERELGLFTALEARSQRRVALGLVEASEQIALLEKVAAAQSKHDAAVAMIEGARLGLLGNCRDDVADEVNGYLVEVLR